MYSKNYINDCQRLHFIWVLYSSRILEVFKFKFLLQIEVVSNNQVMQLTTGLIQFSKL